MEKAVYNVKEVAALLGINLPKAYELARQEGFPAIRKRRTLWRKKCNFTAVL
jgi:predicted DNA-binding transcriptional regulator AlpA